MKNHLLVKSTMERMKLSGRSRAVVDWLVRNSQDQFRIADIGCGYGWTAWNYLQYRNPGIFVCVEPDRATLEIASESITSDKVIFLENLEEVSRQFSTTFDLIVSSEVLEHTKKGSEGAFLSGVRQCLKVGGTALITTPAASFRSRALDPAFWIARHRHYSKRKLLRLIKESNLSVVRLSRAGGSAECFAIWDLYISKWIFRRQPCLQSIYRNKLEREWALSKPGWMGWWIEVQRLD